MSANYAKLIEVKENSEELLKIAEMAAKTLHDERNIMISESKVIPTIVYEFLFSSWQYLDKHKSLDKDVVINLFNLFEMGITCMPSEDGEKDANFTPYLAAGQISKTIIKSDEETEDESE